MSISPSIHSFTFTGKERDEETGFTYHGARYFDAALLTSWMVVDPQSDKYPSLSPYNYCAWNPVKLVDPDGCEFDGWRVTGEGNVIRVNGNGGRHTQTVTFESTGKTVSYSGNQYYSIFNELKSSNWKRTNWGGNQWYSRSSSNNLSKNRALVNVFYDMANNTNIEWAIYQYGNTMAMGHLQKYNRKDGKPGRYSGENHAPSLSDLGCMNARATGIMLHSHPNTPPKNELISLGWSNGEARWGDSMLRLSHPNMQFLVYMKRTSHLISVPNGGKPCVRDSKMTRQDVLKIFHL